MSDDTVASYPAVSAWIVDPTGPLWPRAPSPAATSEPHERKFAWYQTTPHGRTGVKRIMVFAVLGLLVLALPAGCVMTTALAGTFAVSPEIGGDCPSWSEVTPAGCRSGEGPSSRPVDPLSISAPDAQAAVAVAAALIGIAGGGSYVAEGNGPVNFDCSGLTAWAWRQAGVDLVDLSYTQRSQTQDIPRSMVQPGDLVFWFGGSEHHVAIVTSVGGGQITIAEAANPSAGLRTRLLGGGWDDAYLTGFGRVVRA